MKYLLSLLLVVISHNIYCQKKVAITMDDVPRTNNPESSEALLNYLTENDIPTTIFINEGRVVRDSMALNVALLEKWIASPVITPGNHTFSHSRYSTSDFEDFTEDVKKGEYLSKPLSEKYNKEYRHFRFPYNDLGATKAQQDSIAAYLEAEGYRIAPFTVESSDYLYSYLYNHYLRKKDEDNARRIGKAYVNKTIDLLQFFDSLAYVEYGRSIPQIFLCHDFRINADYLPEIVESLKDYEFIAYENALEDEVYDLPNNYYEKWGISWVYRWMDGEKRQSYQRSEPSVMRIHKEYQAVREAAK